MNGVEQKACIFGTLVVAVYAIHQLTVGTDGVVLAGVVGALAAIGGYTIATARLKQQV